MEFPWAHPFPLNKRVANGRYCKLPGKLDSETMFEKHDRSGATGSGFAQGFLNRLVLRMEMDVGQGGFGFAIISGSETMTGTDDGEISDRHA